MIWVSLLTLHLIGLVGYTLLLRKSALSSINKYFLAAAMQTAIFIPSIVFLVLGEVDFDLELVQWVRIVISAFLIVGLHLTAIKALSLLDASLFSIIYNLRLFFVTILGYLFLGELPPAAQIIGGIIIFSSILLLNLHKDNTYKSSPILWGLLATIWLSVHATLEKYNILDIGFETYMFITMLLGSVFLWLLVAQKKVNLQKNKGYINRQFALLLVLRPLSAWSITYALLYGSLAVASYVSGMSVVFIVIAGIIFLHEREHMRQKILATAVGVIGLTVILVSKLGLL